METLPMSINSFNEDDMNFSRKQWALKRDIEHSKKQRPIASEIERKKDELKLARELAL